MTPTSKTSGSKVATERLEVVEAWVRVVRSTLRTAVLWWSALPSRAIWRLAEMAVTAEVVVVAVWLGTEEHRTAVTQEEAAAHVATAVTAAPALGTLVVAAGELLRTVRRRLVVGTA